MFVAGFPSPGTGTNCWVVATGRGAPCVIIDPGIGVAQQLEEIVDDNKLQPTAVLLTHGHIDHTFSVFPVCQARGIPAYIHAGDRVQLTDPWTALGLVPGAPLMGLRNLSLSEPDDVRPLSDGLTVPLAGLDFVVRHAPGHTPGSVVFALAQVESEPEMDLVFSGDVLFAGSIGRVDLPGGSMTSMLESLRRIVLPLPDATVVHPGHGPSTTVGSERLSNPYLRELV